jgi:hypothetical protein
MRRAFGSTGGHMKLDILAGASFMLCSWVLVSCLHRALVFSMPQLDFVCEVHRCTSCDLLWDRLIDVGHITEVTVLRSGRGVSVLVALWGRTRVIRPMHMRAMRCMERMRSPWFYFLQGGSLVTHGIPSTVVLNASFSPLLITYVASMSVEISFFSLCLRGTRLASRLYRCLEYHLYHLAPYALTLVYVIRIVFLYAVPGFSSLFSTRAATTSAYRHLHAQKIMAASSRPTVSPFGRVPRIHFLLLSPASMCRLPTS